MKSRQVQAFGGWQMGTRRLLWMLLVLTSLHSELSAQQTQPADYVPTSENLATRAWFQDAKLGLFIHWGIYSQLADGEWVMELQGIDKKSYSKLAGLFYPRAFNAEEWVLMAKTAGMKYITITAKHHDGFAMYDSKVSDYDIVDASPFGRDPMAELAEACRKHGLRLFFYYSQLDWQHEDYYPRGQTGRKAGRPEQGNFDRYIDYMDAQLEELLTGYGPIGGIWFDGWWDQPQANWRLQQTYSLIHRLQPATLIGSNHHRKPFPGEDFQMFEKDLPGQNTAGYSAESEIGNLPLETVETLNHSWGYNLQDRRYKTVKELRELLVKAAGHNANLMLNVGPMPDGRIQQEFVDTLAALGQWTAKYGESIYGTRQGPIQPQSWGVSTQKDGKIYLHILKADAPALLIEPVYEQIRSIRVLGSNAKVEAEKCSHGWVIPLPEAPGDSHLILELIGN